MNKKINIIIIGIFLFLGALYIGGSLSQYAVGDRSKELLLLITGSIIITNLVAIIEYKRNKLSKTIPWIYSIIYCIIYSIILYKQMQLHMLLQFWLLIMLLHLFI